MTEVTCAVIRNEEGLVLTVRRGPGMSNAGKWEFPGGKVRPGEDHEECIMREIDEELGICIIISGYLEPVEHDYGGKVIRLIPFICDTLASKLNLREHDEFRWVRPDDLIKLDLTAADIPVASEYAARYSAAPAVIPSEEGHNVTSEAGEEMARIVGRITSLSEIHMVAQSAVNDSLLLSQLVTLSMSHEKRVGFMASWALSKVSDINTHVLEPYLGTLVESLPDVANESVQRSFMRVIMKSRPEAVPVSLHSRLIDYCMNIMRNEAVPVAPKAYGMEILASFCNLYPDIAGEVSLAVQMAVTNGSAGIRAQARKIIARLARPA